LWKVVEEADLIVVGKLGELSPVENRRATASIATLAGDIAIDETLKGKDALERVTLWTLDPRIRTAGPLAHQAGTDGVWILARYPRTAKAYRAWNATCLQPRTKRDEVAAAVQTMVRQRREHVAASSDNYRIVLDGPARADDPFYSLELSSANIGSRSRDLSELHAQVTGTAFDKVAAWLAESGFLRNAATLDHPRQRALIPRGSGYGYALVADLRQAGKVLRLEVGLGEALSAHVAGLRGALDGDAARQLDRVIARIEEREQTCPLRLTVRARNPKLVLKPDAVIEFGAKLVNPGDGAYDLLGERRVDEMHHGEKDRVYWVIRAEMALLDPQGRPAAGAPGRSYWEPVLANQVVAVPADTALPLFQHRLPLRVFQGLQPETPYTLRVRVALRLRERGGKATATNEYHVVADTNVGFALPESTQDLVDILSFPSKNRVPSKAAAMRALAARRDPETLDTFLDWSQVNSSVADPRAREIALCALPRFGDVLNDVSPARRMRVCGHWRSLLTESTGVDARRAMLDVLAAWPPLDPNDCRPLVQALGDADLQVRRKALAILQAYRESDETFGYDPAKDPAETEAARNRWIEWRLEETRRDAREWRLIDRDLRAYIAGKSDGKSLFAMREELAPRLARIIEWNLRFYRGDEQTRARALLNAVRAGDGD
jgi:hypothetical protein